MKKKQKTKTVVFHHAFLDLLGSHAAVIFFGQCLWLAEYWEKKMKGKWTGEFYKTCDEWSYELGLSRHQLAEARKACVRGGLIAERRGIGNRVHFRVDVVRARQLIENFARAQKGASGSQDFSDLNAENRQTGTQDFSIQNAKNQQSERRISANRSREFGDQNAENQRSHLIERENRNTDNVHKEKNKMAAPSALTKASWEARFHETFWPNIWPNGKKGFGGALRAWREDVWDCLEGKTEAAADKLLAEIMTGVEQFTKLYSLPHAPAMKYPQGWLTDQRWRDEITDADMELASDKSAVTKSRAQRAFDEVLLRRKSRAQRAIDEARDIAEAEGDTFLNNSFLSLSRQ